jgi:putative heme-binding domain-containing protein
MLHNSPSADVRTKAVFALYRIGTPETLLALRTGLGDVDLQVRVAAARAVGLGKDAGALDKLNEMVRKEEPAVRRQAATALGQIADKRSTRGLLAAAETADDRFIQHAIINSLVILDEPQAVTRALQHPIPEVRQAALIALDQMPSSPLQATQLIPFLESDNLTLKRTGLWVAAHHREWSGDMHKFLLRRFQDGPLADDEKELFTEMLVAYCGDAVTQKFLADQLEGNSKQKVFLLNVMGECPEKEFPQVWLAPLKKILESNGAPEVEAATLELIRLRGITSLTDQLQIFSRNKNKPALLRMEAIAAIIDSLPEFSDSHFEWLVIQLQKKNEAPVRMMAASVLSQGHLNEKQLLYLASQYLPEADAFILPRLVPLFKGEHSSKIGNTLATTLMKSPSLDSYTRESLLAIFEKYPADVRPLVDQLMTRLHDAHAERLDRIHTLEKQIDNGVLENGRTLFFGKAVCWTCHTIGSEGGALGPDLTSIQQDRSAHDLLEAIIYPGLSFVREYETYHIKTKNAEYTGIIQEQNPSYILIGTAPQTSFKIARSEIESMKILNVSVMPQGLDKLLTNQEIADLMAFILGQDQDPETDEHILR